MRTRLLLVLVAALWAHSARAQTSVFHEENRFRSPQHFALELRFGPYSPEVDSEFNGAAEPPHYKYFLDKKKLLFQVELDYEFFRAFGTAAVGVQAGYFKEGAYAYNVAGTDRTGDPTALSLFPTALQLVYRLDVAARRLGIPLVPYAKAGLSYTFWRVTDANGDTARAGDGSKGSGGTPGWQAAVGLALLLDFLDPGAARALDSDTGVNHTYLFGELTRYEASGLGAKNKLHVGDSTWTVGLMFEF
jgi:hypothetical protein